MCLGCKRGFLCFPLLYYTNPQNAIGKNLMFQWMCFNKIFSKEPFIFSDDESFVYRHGSSPNVTPWFKHALIYSTTQADLNEVGFYESTKSTLSFSGSLLNCQIKEKILLLRFNLYLSKRVKFFKSRPFNFRFNSFPWEPVHELT